MRLICPNCGAQYEVDEQVIPDNGRDVQCSNCGHTWFQQPAHRDQELADELGEEYAEEIVDETPEPEAPAEDDPVEPRRRSLDPEVADILREEAALEEAAREAENAGLETQPDLGLDQAEADRDRDVTRARLAAVAEAAREQAELDPQPEPDPLAEEIEEVEPRRDRLPDVEEVSGSLREMQAIAEQEIEEVDDEVDEAELAAYQKMRRRAGFRLGFGIAIILAACAATVYIYAADFVQSVPASEPYLIAYVEFVNGIRDQTEPLVQSAIAWVNGMITRFTG